MANHPSAAKRHRQIVTRTAINDSLTTRLRHSVKTVEAAIEAGDKDAARAAFVAAQPEMQSSARKGILHHRTASRKLSRLSKRIKAL